MFRFVVVVVVCRLAPLLAAQSPPQAPYVPPTWHERGSVFFHRATGLQAVYGTLPAVAFGTVRDFPTWGRGPVGIGKRTASQYGEFLVGESLEMTISGLRSEDPRYLRRGEQAPMLRRIGLVLASMVATKNAKGNWTVGMGRIANTYGSRAIASRWGPAVNQTAGSVLFNASIGLGTAAGANAFREFWPDVKKALHHKP